MASVPVQASPGGNRPARRAVTLFAAGLAASVLLGLLAGVIWGEVAPRALLREIGHGTAQLVDAETTAFIAADAWFCGISVVAGLLTGLLGHRFLVASRDPRASAFAAAGLVLGGVAGAFVMLWLGERIGVAGYNADLAASPKGTLFHASLALGAKSALAFWPMFTAIVILVFEWGRRPTRSVMETAPPGPEFTV